MAIECDGIRRKSSREKMKKENKEISCPILEYETILDRNSIQIDVIWVSELANGEVNISHGNITMVVWIYDGV